MTQPKTYARSEIAAEFSDLRQMRGALSDIIMTACGLMSQTSGDDVPDEIKVLRLSVAASLAAAEQADKIAQDRMRQLHAMPTPAQIEAANDEKERAA